MIKTFRTWVDSKETEMLFQIDKDQLVCQTAEELESQIGLSQ